MRKLVVLTITSKRKTKPLLSLLSELRPLLVRFTAKSKGSWLVVMDTEVFSRCEALLDRGGSAVSGRVVLVDDSEIHQKLLSFQARGASEKQLAAYSAKALRAIEPSAYQSLSEAARASDFEGWSALKRYIYYYDSIEERAM